MNIRLTLHTRLTLAYSTIFLLLVLTLGALVYGVVRFQLEDAADEELKNRADAVLRLLRTEEGSRQPSARFHELEEHLDPSGKTEAVRISDLRSTVVFQSGGVVAFTSPAAGAGMGFSNVRSHRATFRIFRKQIDLGGPYILELGIDRSEYVETLEALRDSLYWGIPVGLLLSFFAGRWMSGRVLRPLQIITETVRDIDDRRLAVRLPLRGTRDELDVLAQTLNSMLDRLQNSFHRISRFTADASHELRTPLALVRGNAEVMRRESALPPAADARAGEILIEVDRMQTLIQDLLELARSDEGGHAISELIDPSDLARRAAETGAQLAAARQVPFVAEGPREIFPLRGNDRSLHRVLVILLDNAIRHSNSGQEVTLSVSSTPTEFTAQVRDTGGGISEEHLPRIFERFYRTDDSRNRTAGGAGLGLAIAQAIVAAHQGSITVESEPGAGSVFRVVIPARR